MRFLVMFIFSAFTWASMMVFMLKSYVCVFLHFSDL